MLKLIVKSQKITIITVQQWVRKQQSTSIILNPISYFCISTALLITLTKLPAYTRFLSSVSILFYLCGLVCGLAELVVCGRAVCVTLVRRYLSLRSCLWSCGQVLGTPKYNAGFQAKHYPSSASIRKGVCVKRPPAPPAAGGLVSGGWGPQVW